MELSNKSVADNYRETQYTFTPHISEKSRKLAVSGSKSKRQSRNVLQTLNTDRPLTDRAQISVMGYDRNKTSMD